MLDTCVSTSHRYCDTPESILFFDPTIDMIGFCGNGLQLPPQLKVVSIRTKHELSLICISWYEKEYILQRLS